MTGPTLHARALALFDELLELDVAERTRRLAALARADPTLHAETSALLAADQLDHGLLERTPVLPDGERQDDEHDDGADALLGRHIGPWRIDGIVGRGGMGAVYRGERDDGQFRQRAAIKLIRLGMDDAQSRRRFLRERQILAGLQHPNVAALLDGGVTDAGAPYFAMELVDGLPIDRHCDQRRLDLRARMRLFLQVCAAVQYAHQNLVVHRDLKPGNILVTEDGQARLLDFGIAKLLEDDNLDTHTRGRPLTPEYAAPEQLRGEAITTAADVYALGVLLYDLLADAHPFARDGRNPVQRQLALLEREPEPITHAAVRIDTEAAHARGLTPRALAAALRGDLAAIVHRCLQAEPARRYASAEMLANDLRAWLEGRPVTARVGHRGYRLRKFVVRHRWGVVASVAAVLAICGALGMALVQARRATLQAERNAHTRDFVVTLFENANPTKSDRGTQLTAAELLGNAARRVDAELVGAPGTQAQLRTAIGYSLLQLGETGRGAQLLERGAAQMRTLDPPAASMANALQKLAMAREALGDLDGAGRALQQAVELLPQADGDHRLEAIQYRTSLASLMVSRGRLPQALAQYQRIQRDRAQLLGADDPAAAVDWNNLGTVYLKLDRCTEAVQAYHRTRELLARGLGPEHPRNVWVLFGLAAARDCTGQYAQAEADFAEGERLMLRTLSAEHPLAISLHNGRGNSQYRQGHPAEAEAHYARGLAMARERQVPAVVTLMQGRVGLAQLAQGRAAEAETMLAAALAGMTGTGQDATDPLYHRLHAAHGLARFLTGERASGEREARAAIAALERANQTASEDYAESAGDLATLLETRGAIDEAAVWRRREHDAFVATFGAAHPRSIRAARAIAVTP